MFVHQTTRDRLNSVFTVESLFGKSGGRRPWLCGQPPRVVGLGRDGTSNGTYESRSCPLLLHTIRPHRISKRFSWNTGGSFNSNLSLNKSLTRHRLSATARRKNLLRTREFLHSRNNHKINEVVKSKLEGILHTITLLWLMHPCVYYHTTRVTWHFHISFP